MARNTKARRALNLIKSETSEISRLFAFVRAHIKSRRLLCFPDERQLEFNDPSRSLVVDILIDSQRLASIDEIDLNS